ncbi:MAG: tripartite tricarboxylate transporter substrate binding protein [Burkholderiales bacterium]|nr:tripartite tricarboxylate transporter substrate binding protein [Burkholderiales bacterium]
MSFFSPFVRRIATGGALILAATAVGAQTAPWPSQPIRIVVPYPAGGTSDTVARVVGRRLGEQLGVPVIIENRPGASGNIGAQVVAKSPGNGYTLMVGGPNNFASNQFLYKHLQYDIEKELVGVTLLTQLSNLMLVPNSLKVADLKEFIAAAKAKPNTFNCASTGLATSSHLTLELFKSKSQVDAQHIPMKGSAGVVTELMGERVECAFDNMPGHLSHLKTGRYRALAVTTTKRSPYLPDVPTFTELGYPGVVSTSWFALAAPASTPPALVARISEAVRKVLAEREIIATFEAAGYTPGGTTPEETAEFFSQEIRKWRQVIEAAGIKAE